MAKKNSKTKKFSLFINGKFDYSILIVTLLLLSVGLIVLLSASAPKALSEEDKNGNSSSYTYFIKQGEFAIIGLVSMYLISKVDYRILKKFKWILYICTVAILIIVGVSSLGRGTKGATRWIQIGPISLQPSEFAKVSLIVFYATILSDVKEKGKMKSIWSGFLKPIILFAPIVFAIFKLQNHFSATFIIGMILCVQMFVAGTRLTYFFGAGGLGAIGALTYLALKSTSGAESSGDFRSARIQTWLDLEHADLIGDAWQITQSLYAIGSGGLFGLGLGNSKQKYLYLPEPQNDFIFAVLAEELGFFGSILVILLFALFIWRGIVIAMKAQDSFGTLIAIGVTTMIGLQALINLAVVTNTMPVTGMPLPFFSYGGSAMIADLMAVGLLLSVSRNNKKNAN
jgi:cell division protein FtsW